MSLAQLVRPVDMVRQNARQRHLGISYRVTGGEDKKAFSWRLQVDATPCKEPWVVVNGDNRDLAVAVRSHADAPLVGERAWTDFHDDARLMAWTLQHDALLDQLGSLTGRNLAPTRLMQPLAPHDAALDGPHLGFELSDPAGKLLARGTLAVDDDDFEQIITGAEKLPGEKLPSQWAGVPIPLALRTPTLTISAQTLRDCREGDIVVLGHRERLYERLRAFHTNGQPLPARCTFERGEVRVTVDGAPLPTRHFEEPPTMSNADAEGASGTDTNHHGPAPAHQIPVQLCVQTGAVDVMLSDLEGLEAGAVLPLEAPLAGTNVTILVNGAALGDGELVAAGDKLGVCIKRWRPDGL